MLYRGVATAIFLALATATDVTPCITGSCTYSSGDGVNLPYMFLTIDAEKPTSLSDITKAAGWDIINCDPNSAAPQDIRLVCTDKSKGCNQLFDGGESNTVIRLPDDCSGGPFARVAKSRISEDQRVPARLANRRLDSPVLTLTIDFDFAQIPQSQGRVFITASAMNSRAQWERATRSAAQRSSRFATRSSHANKIFRDFIGSNEKSISVSPRCSFFDCIGEAINDAIGTIGDAINDGVEAISSLVQGILDNAANAVISFVHTLEEATSFNETASVGVHVISINETSPVFVITLTCRRSGVLPDVSASVSVKADVQAKLDAEFGVIFVGSIIPPHIDDIAFTSHGNFGGTFDINATATGAFNTGHKPLVKAGLPILNIPGILKLDTISLNVQAIVSLGVTAEIKVTSSIDLPKVWLVFPPNDRHGNSHAQAIPNPASVSVTVGKSQRIEGRAELHLIPKIEFGISLFSEAEARVFLNADGSASVYYSLSTNNATEILESAPTVPLSDVDQVFAGTVGAGLKLALNAGATVALVPFFNATASEQFSKTFTIFEKTFGPASNSASIARRGIDLPNLPGDQLICPLELEFNVQQPILQEVATTPLISS